MFQGEPSKTRRLKSEAAEAIDEEDDDDDERDDEGTKKIADQETEKRVTDYMSPVSPVFHTIVTVSIGLKKHAQSGNIHSKILDV